MDNIYLIHHGVLGMKWGVRRYQNYDGTLKHPKGRKGSNKVKTNRNKIYNYYHDDKGNLDKKKLAKTVAIGVGVTAGILLTVGGIHLAKKHGLIQNGKEYVDNINANIGTSSIFSVEEIRKEQLYNKIDLPDIKDLDLKGITNQGTIGKSPNQINKTLLKSINHDTIGLYGFSPERSMNCGKCSLSYIMNSVFGYPCSAREASLLNVSQKDLIKATELPNIVINGNTDNQLLAAFNNVKVDKFFKEDKWTTPLESLPEFDIIKSKTKPNSTGLLMIQGPMGSHWINYEKDSKGVLTLIDTQNDLIGDKAYDFFKNNGFRCREILDFSNAELKPNAGRILKYFLD